MTLLIILGLIFIISIIIILFLLIFSFTLSKWIKPLITENAKTPLKIFYLMVQLLTILSIVSGIVAFYYEQSQQQRIQKENDEIILSNMKEEVTHNLGLIYFIRENAGKYRNSPEFTTDRFEFYYIEKAQDIIKEKNSRVILIEVTRSLKKSNRGMDMFSGSFFFPMNEEQLELYKKLKNDIINSLMDKFDRIEPNLKETAKIKE